MKAIHIYEIYEPIQVEFIVKARFRFTHVRFFTSMSCINGFHFNTIPCVVIPCSVVIFC